TGTHAFGEGGAEQLLYRIVNEEPELEGISHDLRPLIRQCLAKDPAVRPTAAELVALLAAGPGTHERETFVSHFPHHLDAEVPTIRPMHRRRKTAIAAAVTAAVPLALLGRLAVEQHGGSGADRTRAGAGAPTVTISPVAQQSASGAATSNSGSQSSAV